MLDRTGRQDWISNRMTSVQFVRTARKLNNCISFHNNKIFFYFNFKGSFTKRGIIETVTYQYIICVADLTMIFPGETVVKPCCQRQQACNEPSSSSGSILNE